MSRPLLSSAVTGTALLGAAVLVTAPAGAQVAPAPDGAMPVPVERPRRATRAGESRLQGGVSFALAQPVHEFRGAVPRAAGAAGHLLYRVGASGAAALRADAAVVTYGRERRRVSLLSDFGPVPADLSTRNNVITAGVGPQLMAPAGAVRPYAHASVGFAAFTTVTTLTDPYADPGGGGEEIDSRQDHGSATWAAGAGGGVLVRLAQSPNSTAFLDLGARYHDNGRARYLRQGSITRQPGGGVRVDVREGPANFWTYQIGVSFGGRGAR